MCESRDESNTEFTIAASPTCLCGNCGQPIEHTGPTCDACWHQFLAIVGELNASPRPQRLRLPKTFSLRAVFEFVTIVAICYGAGSHSPMLGIVLAIVSIPAFVMFYTLVAAEQQLEGRVRRPFRTLICESLTLIVLWELFCGGIFVTCMLLGFAMPPTLSGNQSCFTNGGPTFDTSVNIGLLLIQVAVATGTAHLAGSWVFTTWYDRQRRWLIGGNVLVDLPKCLARDAGYDYQVPRTRFIWRPVPMPRGTDRKLLFRRRRRRGSRGLPWRRRSRFYARCPFPPLVFVPQHWRH